VAWSPLRELCRLGGLDRADCRDLQSRGAATNLFGQRGDLFGVDEAVARQQFGAIDAEIGCGNPKVVRGDQRSLVQLVVVRGPRQLHRGPDLFPAEGSARQVGEHGGKFLAAVIGIHEKQGIRISGFLKSESR
jgi:hypothetical protein